MIRYAFLAQLDPPAPFVNVVVRNLATGAELRDLPAQLDTAADRTVLPESLVGLLGLPQVGTLKLGGFGGATFTLPVYPILLGLHDLPAQPFKVAAHAEESWILLGRDVLNSFRVLLDGPQLALEIG
ncbi:MAG TPA: hypothetical protein VK395_27390 [Gemmataceae bacterium]|nr:hypothetical protein [Gemmataceae bacterium]